MKFVKASASIESYRSRGSVCDNFCKYLKEHDLYFDLVAYEVDYLSDTPNYMINLTLCRSGVISYDIVSAFSSTTDDYTRKYKDEYSMNISAVCIELEQANNLLNRILNIYLENLYSYKIEKFLIKNRLLTVLDNGYVIAGDKEVLAMYVSHRSCKLVTHCMSSVINEIKDTSYIYKERAGEYIFYSEEVASYKYEHIDILGLEYEYYSHPKYLYRELYRSSLSMGKKPNKYLEYINLKEFMEDNIQFDIIEFKDGGIAFTVPF